MEQNTQQNTQQYTQPVYQESYDYYTSQTGGEPKKGMPWWGILLIVIGGMGVLAVIMVVVLIVLSFMLTFVGVSRQTTPSYMGIDDSSTAGTVNPGDTSHDPVNTVVTTEAAGEENNNSQDDFGKEETISGYGAAVSILMVPQGFEPDKESSYSDMIFYINEDYNMLYYSILPYSTAQDVIDNYTDYADDDNATISTGSYTNDEGQVFQYLCVESVYGSFYDQEITFAADMGNGCVCKLFINNLTEEEEETVSPEEYFYLLDSDALQFSIEEEQE